MDLNKQTAQGVCRRTHTERARHCTEHFLYHRACQFPSHVVCHLQEHSQNQTPAAHSKESFFRLERLFFKTALFPAPSKPRAGNQSRLVLFDAEACVCSFEFLVHIWKGINRSTNALKYNENYLIKIRQQFKQLYSIHSKQKKPTNYNSLKVISETAAFWVETEVIFWRRLFCY